MSPASAILPQIEPQQSVAAARSANGSPCEERLSPAGERCRVSDRVGNLASRSDD